ncbi:polymerase [Mycobacterium asiaticum]|uniref:Polymerase n=1 Tax=Mycobacterium asiaticum TaxID=1790 RepID=A0A1A3NPS4_MYCAS|nr:O-antigen ligase family protein [Mycobacterium asiaticum]OBK23064.1 polymerase [Mycobacterium asiaticum]
MAAVMLALFAFGCFVYGALSVRNTTQGIMLVGLTFFLIVYWAKPELMIGLALFLGCAALPQGLHVGKVIGPVSIYAAHVVLILAICFVLPVVRLRMSDYFLPGAFGLMVVYSAAVGFSTGHNTAVVVRETTFLFEMLAGFVLALVVVYGEYIILTIHAMAFTLWFSAGMAVLGSSGGIRLAGRTESLQMDTGDAANRVITSTLIPAIAVLTALVAAQIAGRVKPSAYLTLGLPALVIAVLAFSRNTLLSVGVAAIVAFFASMGWSAVRRAARLTLIGVGILAVSIPGALFLLGDTSAGVWLANQITGFSHRVLGRSTGTALTQDPSTLARFAEDRHLNEAIGAAPVFGHGLGYAYQLPFGGDDPTEFTQTLGTTYAHNFYLWWLAKSGAVGMTAFAVLALTPLVRALRSASVPAKIAASTSAGLLVMCVVDPLPEDPANAMTLGLALGAAMAFAALRHRRCLESQVVEDVSDIEPPALPVGALR